MPISNVDITDTLNFGRQIVNQISSNLNAFLGSQGMTVTGNIIVAPASSTANAIDVRFGYIAGNGFNLFSIPTTSIILSSFRNSQLQNSSITIVAGAGMNGGGALSLGGSISVNITPADSVTNSNTILSVSANSIRWANTILASVASDANGVNTGTLATSFGGTGRVTYTVDGQVLIGTTEGSLTTNTIRPSVGMTATYGPGSLSFGANLIQGTNTLVVGNQITVNAPPLGTTTTLGIVRLDDTTSCTSTTLAGTINSVNSLHTTAIAKYTSFSLSQDSSGRLLEYRVYNTPGTYTWTKPANTGAIEITLIGAGGGGAGAGNGAGPIGTLNVNYGSGGFAGAMLQARIANANLNTSYTITIGYGGNSSGLFRTGRVGYRGGNTIFTANTLNTHFDYYANGGNGGLTQVDATKGANCITWRLWPNSSLSMLSTARSPTDGAPQPEYVLKFVGAPPDPLFRLSKGNTVGSFGAAVPGWCSGGWVSYATNTSTGGGSCPVCWGPDGNTASEASNGSGFGGGGGGGGFNDTASPGSGTRYVNGASGANGLVIIKVYSK